MYQNQAVFKSVPPAPTGRTLCAKPKLHARSVRDKKRSEEACPKVFNGNGFLNHRFLPMIKSLPQELKNREKTRRDFFFSVENLCILYGIDLGDYRHIPYPQDMALAFAELKDKMNQTDDALILKILATEESSACIATVKRFDTGMTLFYLPVEPLFELLKDKDRKGVAELLLSACSYLNQIIGIPYHTDNNSYLGYMYEIVAEWNSEAEYFDQAEELQIYLEEVTEIRKKGEWLAKKISDRKQLKLFGKRLKNFHPVSVSESAFKKNAEKLYRLMQEFPTRSVMDNIYGGIFEDPQEERNMIDIDQYLSFMWSSSDCLFDQLMDSVNAELNECNEMDMPMTIQLFDLPHKVATHDLSFETELFDLLHEISDSLNDFAHEKYHTST